MTKLFIGAYMFIFLSSLSFMIFRINEEFKIMHKILER